MSKENRDMQLFEQVNNQRSQTLSFNIFQNKKFSCDIITGLTNWLALEFTNDCAMFLYNLLAQIHHINLTKQNCGLLKHILQQNDTAQ